LRHRISVLARNFSSGLEFLRPLALEVLGCANLFLSSWPAPILLDAGTLQSVSINARTHAVRVELAPADPYTSQARLRIEQPAKVAGVSRLVSAMTGAAQERGAWVTPLSDRPTQIDSTDLPAK